MEEPILLSGFSNTDLVDMKYHIDHEEFSNSFIELIISDKTGSIRHLRFDQVSGLEIEKGFQGNLSGMVIVNIKDRQWANLNVEVQNTEQDPGITFLAKSMKVLVDEFY